MRTAFHILAGLSVVALVASSGCAFGPTHKLDRTLSAAYVSASPLIVKTHNGSISIQEYAGSTVEVSAYLQSRDMDRLQAAQVNAVRGTDGALSISVTWPENVWRSNDGCRFEILVPDTTGITAQTSNGRIEITGLSGGVDATTSNGRIIIAAHDGPLTLRTSNGRIMVTDATSAVNAETSNGRVRVSLAADNPGPVNIGSSNGEITLDVGPAFSGLLTADTSNGIVNFGPFVGEYRVNTEHTSRSRGSATFGAPQPGTPTSVVDTSNGSITIRGRG